MTRLKHKKYRDSPAYCAHHRDVDALGSVTKGEDSHCAHSLQQMPENSMTRMPKQSHIANSAIIV